MPGARRGLKLWWARELPAGQRSWCLLPARPAQPPRVQHYNGHYQDTFRDQPPTAFNHEELYSYRYLYSAAPASPLACLGLYLHGAGWPTVLNSKCNVGNTTLGLVQLSLYFHSVSWRELQTLRGWCYSHRNCFEIPKNEVTLWGLVMLDRGTSYTSVSIPCSCVSVLFIHISSLISIQRRKGTSQPGLDCSHLRSVCLCSTVKQNVKPQTLRKDEWCFLPAEIE